MSRAAAVALWIACASVTWNVVFDWRVAVAARAFTQEQIVRYHRGEPTARIDVAFQPRVGDAALTASLYAGVVLACGAVFVSLSRQNRSQ